jgi:chromosome segregation protein
MRLDRIILHGFKSFAHRTAFQFDHPITGVVGPNGSGKSNLVEGLRWVVGARARELRGEEAQSLLFHGAQAQPPMPFAEVVVELSRPDGRLEVRRRLERGGGSELRLGGRPGSLKSLEISLAGSGLSRHGYAILGQGEVGQVLQAGPEVLLAYLEEAAGLRGVALSARLAHDRMEEAARQLVQLEQTLQQRQQTLQQRQQQAELARRATELSQELLALRHGVWRARKVELQQEASTHQNRVGVLQAERHTLNQELEELSRQRPLAQDRAEQAAGQLALAQQQAEGSRGQQALARQQLNHLKLLEDRIVRSLEESQQRCRRLAQQMPPVLPAVSQPDAQTLPQLEEALRQLEAQRRSLQIQLDTQQKAYQVFIRAQASYETSAANHQQLVQQFETAQQHSTQTQLQLQQAEENLEGFQQEALQLQAQLEQLRQRQSSLEGQAQAALREVDRLQAVVRQGTDLAEGPRKVRQAGLAGLLGVVAELLEVDAGLEVALEVALGARLQWVLARDDAAVKRGIDYLKVQGGRATFLPLTQLRTSGSARSPQGEGVVGLASQLARIPQYPQVLGALLGETTVVESLDAALALRQQGGRSLRMVTLEGELLESGGSVTGGRLQRQGQLLAIRRRLAEAQQEAEQAQTQLENLSQQYLSTRSQLDSLPLAQLRQEVANLRALLQSLRRQLAQPPQPPQPPQICPAPEAAPLEALEGQRQTLENQRQTLRDSLQAWETYQRERLRYQEAQEQLALEHTQQTSLSLEAQGVVAQREHWQQQLQLAQQAEQALQLAALEEVQVLARSEQRRLADEESRRLARSNRVLQDLEEAQLALARRLAGLELLEAELSQLPPADQVPVGSSRQLTRQLEAAQAALQALGPVNHLAGAEQQALQEQVDQLEAAQLEAAQVLQALQAELSQIRIEHKQRLGKAFSAFSTRFSELAQALLGAEGLLELQGEGLQLRLRPGGKRTLDLNLLSMGERTMGAMAFLFALAAANPEQAGLPMAILDEVDAALDEANLVRFCQFLERFSSSTQFILVTHQKRTMEVCQALYGVTSQQGVSQVYSIKRD